ncbi:MAG: response regulator [Verrucomicrobia bacterium]|nr:response regulator [Verrucomicrobiota bacterium]
MCERPRRHAPGRAAYPGRREPGAGQDYARLNPEAKPGPYVVFLVADTGTGIPPEVMDKIFDPFFTTKDPGKGTGLGLATVLGIVKGHGGFVQVQSHPGQGSVFHAYLPAIGGLLAPSSEVTARPPQWRGRGELVLLVDDEESVREIARRTLQSHGYHVLVAADGAEGLATFRAQSKAIHLLVTDMVMPILDGATLIRAARQIEPGLPVVAMSGLHAQQEEAMGPHTKADAFLSKPFTSDRLLASLHRALGSRTI